MFCPNCGQENPSPFGYCIGCKRALTTLGGIAVPEFGPTTPPAPRTMSVTAKIFLILVSALAVLVGIFKPVEAGTSAYMEGEHIGTLIALLGFPALVAWIFAGRSKVRHPNRFVLIFCCVSGVFILGNASSFMNGIESPEQRIARLMREAAGLQPESHRGFGRRRRFDDQVRQQYHKLVQRNRDYMATIHAMDISKVKELNSANTFTNPQDEREGLAQLHSLYDADTDQEQKLRAIMADLRHIMETESSSNYEREAILRGFDESSTAQLKKRQDALATEKAWIDAVDDLHAYTNAHHDGLMAANGHLIIPDPEVRREFNAKVRAQEEKRQVFVKVQEQFNQSQAQLLRKMGLSQKDVGGK